MMPKIVNRVLSPLARSLPKHCGLFAGRVREGAADEQECDVGGRAGMCPGRSPAATVWGRNALEEVVG